MSLKAVIDELQTKAEADGTVMDWYHPMVQALMRRVLEKYDIRVEWMSTPCACVRGMQREIEARTYKVHGDVDDAVRNVHGALGGCFHPYGFSKMRVQGGEEVYLMRFGNSSEPMSKE